MYDLPNEKWIFFLHMLFAGLEISADKQMNVELFS